MVIGNLIAKMGLDMSAFNAGLLKAQTAMEKTGAKMQKVGKQMSLYVSLPLAGVAIAAGKTSMAFEDSMSKIVGLVGVAKETVAGWEKEIKQMAYETGRSAKELANAMYFITSSGIEASECMAILDVSAKAAAAGLGETEAIANLVTSAMNAYGAENLSAAQAVDILVVATKAGKAEAADLAEAMSTVLPLSAAMGVSFDQASAAMAALTLTGASASEAATGLRAIMASILTPTTESEKALSAMGTSSSVLRKTIREDGLLKAMQDINNLSKIYGETTASTVIPNIRALSAFLDVMGSNAEGNAKIFDDLKNSTGALDVAFNEATNTMKFKWDQAMASGKNALISIGDAMKETTGPALGFLAEQLQGVSKRFEEMNPATKMAFSGLVGIGVAIGPVVNGLGTFMRNLPLAIKGIKQFGGALVSLMKTMLANPWMLIAAGIAAIGFALYNLIRKSNEAKNSLKSLAESQNEIVSAASKTHAELFLLEQTIKNTTLTTEQHNAAVDKYNKIAKQAGLRTIGYEDSMNSLNTTMQTNIKLLYARALAEASVAEQAAATQNYLKERQAIESSNKSEKTKAWSLHILDKGYKEYMESLQATNRVMTSYIETQDKAQKNDEASAAKMADLLTIIDDETLSLQKRNYAIDEYNKLAAASGGTTMARITSPTGPTGVDLGAIAEAEDAAKEAADKLDANRKRMEKTRDGMLDDLANYTTQRILAGQNELQQLTTLEENKLAELEKARVEELSFYDSKGTEYAAIDKKWQDLSLQYQQEYIAQRAAAEQKMLEDQNKMLATAASQLISSLMTEEEKIEAAYQNQWGLITMLMTSGAISTEKAIELFKKASDAYKIAVDEMNEKDLTPLAQKWADASDAIGGAVKSAMTDMLVSMSEAVGQGMTSAQEYGKMTLTALGDLAIAVGKIAIQTGVALLAVELSLETLGGVGAIVAGAALVALGTAAKASMKKQADSMGGGSLQGLATGGIVTKSGSFIVGEKGRERVTLPAGAAVTPNHMLGGFGDMQLVGVIQGSDLKIILDRTEAKTKRR